MTSEDLFIFSSSQVEIYGCKKQVRWAHIAAHGTFSAVLLMQSHSRLTTVMHFLIQWAHPLQKCSRNRDNPPSQWRLTKYCVIGVDCMKCHAPSPLPALLDLYKRLPMLLYLHVHVALVWRSDLSTLRKVAIKSLSASCKCHRLSPQRCRLWVN